MSNMKMFRWCYPKIAVNTLMGMHKIIQPNITSDLGIFHANIGILPQLKMLSPQQKPSVGIEPESSYSKEQGKGKIYVPEYKDYYLGEGEGF